MQTFYLNRILRISRQAVHEIIFNKAQILLVLSLFILQWSFFFNKNKQKMKKHMYNCIFVHVACHRKKKKNDPKTNVFIFRN